MPSPGSSHALVLPSTAGQSEDLTEMGKRLGVQLEAFLDATKYKAIAVVHGLSPTAASAFDLAKLRRTNKTGVVWVTDADMLPYLGGAQKALLKKLLKAKAGYVLSFASIEGKRVTGHLHWGQLRSSELDRQFAGAKVNEVSGS